MGIKEKLLQNSIILTFDILTSVYYELDAIGLFLYCELGAIGLFYETMKNNIQGLI